MSSKSTFVNFHKILLFIVVSTKMALLGNDGSDSYILTTGKKAISYLENQQKYLAEDSLK